MAEHEIEDRWMLPAAEKTLQDQRLLKRPCTKLLDCASFSKDTQLPPSQVLELHCEKLSRPAGGAAEMSRLTDWSQRAIWLSAMGKP